MCEQVDDDTTTCPSGHNLSHIDGNSTEGDSAGGKNPAQTGPGCFKNFDHFPNRHRRSNSSSQNPCLPLNDGPPIPPLPITTQLISPSTTTTTSTAIQKRLLDISQPEEQQLLTATLAPLAQDETQYLVASPRGYISPVVSLNLFYILS